MRINIKCFFGHKYGEVEEYFEHIFLLGFPAKAGLRQKCLRCEKYNLITFPVFY
jgi:hypothetical protein